MPFTFQALNEDNTVSTAELSLTLTPATAIFTETNWVGGSSATGIINVANDNPDVDVVYYVSADWYAAAGDTPQNARLLAERLDIEVTADPSGTPEVLYTGKLAGLIQQPPAGRLLNAATNEDVEFALNLDPAAATDLIQGMAIEFDLVFVAVEA